MAQRLSDEHVTVAVRAVVIAAEIVLTKMRDPEFLALAAEPGSDGAVVVVDDEPEAPEAGRGARLRALAKQGGTRARQGLAAGLEKWAAERPGSAHWETLGVDERCDWWSSTLGRATSVLAALPGLAGAVGEQVPVGDLVSAAGQGLLLCAIAQEHGIHDHDDHVELLGAVVLERELVAPAGRAARRQAQDDAGGLVPELADRSPAVSKRALATGLALVRMGRSLQALQNDLDHRPQGHVGQRMAGALPVVGVVGHYRGERRGLRLVSERGREWCQLRRAALGPSIEAPPVVAAAAPVPVPVPVPVPASADSPPAPALPSSSPTVGTTRDDVLAVMHRIGAQRVARGEGFDASGPDGYFFHEDGDRRVAVVVWDAADTWTASVFSCARVRMHPTLELYRYVSRWRCTSGVAAPYVAEDQGFAAVMCETTIGGAACTDVVSVLRLLDTMIDLVGGTAELLGRDLARADGIPFDARGITGLGLMCSWWDVRDDRILDLIELGGVEPGVQPPPAGRW